MWRTFHSAPHRTEGDPMTRFCSIFSQLLQHVVCRPDGGRRLLRHAPETHRRVPGRADATAAPDRRHRRRRLDRDARHTASKYPPRLPLRRVEVALPDGDRLVFLTNHPGARRDHDRADLQGPLADRALLQNPEAAPAGEDLCRDLRQRAPHSDLDRADRRADPQIPATAGLVWLVALQSRGAAAHERSRIATCGPG